MADSFGREDPKIQGIEGGYHHAITMGRDPQASCADANLMSGKTCHVLASVVLGPLTRLSRYLTTLGSIGSNIL